MSLWHQNNPDVISMTSKARLEFESVILHSSLCYHAKLYTKTQIIWWNSIKVASSSVGLASSIAQSVRAPWCCWGGCWFDSNQRVTGYGKHTIVFCWPYKIFFVFCLHVQVWWRAGVQPPVPVRHVPGGAGHDARTPEVGDGQLCGCELLLLFNPPV